MKLYRALAVGKRVFRDVINDRRTVILILVTPIISMLLFGYTFGTDIKNVNVIVVNEDKGVFNPQLNVTDSISDKIVANVNPQTLKISYMDNVSEAVNQVKNGHAYGVVQFPSDLTSEVYAKAQNSSYTEKAPITVMLDKSNTEVANSISSSLNDAVSKTVDSIGISSALSINNDPIYGNNFKLIDFSVPGITTFAVFAITLQLTLVSFVNERTSGTLQRLFISPLKESEIVAGYAMAFCTIGTAQATLILAVAIAAFHITVAGNIFIALGVIILLVVASQSLGILISSVAKRELQVIQFIPALTLIAFLLCGIVWPLEGVPSWLLPISYILPPTYAVHGLRSVLLKGWGLDKIWLDIVALVLFEVVFLVLAMWELKRWEA